MKETPYFKKGVFNEEAEQGHLPLPTKNKSHQPFPFEGLEAQRAWFGNAIADSMASFSVKQGRVPQHLVDQAKHDDNLAYWSLLRAASIEALCN